MSVHSIQTQTLAYPDFAFANGLIDEPQRAVAEKMGAECAAAIDAGSWTNASSVCQGMSNFILKSAGNVNEYDIRTFEQYDTLMGYVSDYLDQPEVMQALYASHTFSSTSNKVAAALNDDLMQSTEPLMPFVLQHMRVLIYNGQFDYICNLVGVQNVYYNLNWSGQQEFRSAQRDVWTEGGKVYGYARSAQNLTQLIAVDGGHLYPMDQPEIALSMLRHLITDTPFGSQ